MTIINNIDEYKKGLFIESFLICSIKYVVNRYHGGLDIVETVRHSQSNIVL